MDIDFTQVAASFGGFVPEAVLGLFFVGALLLEAFTHRRHLIAVWALLGYGIAGWFAFARVAITAHGLEYGVLGVNSFGGDWLFRMHDQVAGQGLYVVDDFAVYFKVLVAVAAILVTVFSMLSEELEVEGRPRLGEYYGLMIAMTFGMFLMASANDLLVAYMGIEILSLSSYAITGFTKNVARSAEASMKYVIYGGVSSGIMLFGISLIYGVIGSTNFSEILLVLGTPNALVGTADAVAIASVMVLAGLAYKISAAPFHFWTPDVYEGAPITMTAFLSVASKAAGFALLVRFLVTSYPPMLRPFDWTPILATVAVLTMTLGNLAALQQTNLKRLLAYSSIAHAGYMLLGVVVGTSYGVAAIMVYFAVYLVMNLGGFFAVQKIAEQIGSEELEDYRGLGAQIPVVGVFFSVFMISLVGLPPTGGFIGKFFIFSALVNEGSTWVWLAVIGVVNSVISLYYYLRVLKVMYLEKAAVEPTGRIRIAPVPATILGALAIATILLGLPTFFGPLIEIAQGSLGVLAHLLTPAAGGPLGGL